MPAFDREDALKKADKALRQGRIDAAIDEYVRIVEAQPRDWNSANALGDLYVRANQIERGVAQYTRIADHLAGEGFHSKAAALYKKILKVKPGDEYALLQSGEIAFKQGLLADAKAAFGQIADRRRARKDKKGAAEMSIRIGLLDPDDLDGRLSAARAALEIGDNAVAFREFREVGVRLDGTEKQTQALTALQAAHDIDGTDPEVRARLLAGYLVTSQFDRARAVASSAQELKQVAASLESAGHTGHALDVLVQVAAADPADLDVRASLARAYATTGDFARAREFLTPETAVAHPELWLTLAEIELSSQRLAEGRAAVLRAIAVGPAERDGALALVDRLAGITADGAYQCADALVQDALEAGDFSRAASVLERLTRRLPTHILALMRLIEIAVDGGLDHTMYEAQAQLADAYVAAGRGLEARIISEDLVARDPGNAGNIERFRRALVLLGEKDPETIIAERLSSESPFFATEQIDFNEGQDLASPLPSPAAPAWISPSAEAHSHGTEPEEVDLSDQLLDEAPEPTATDLEAVISGLRADSARTPGEERALEQYRSATRLYEMGLVEDAIKALESAARSPRQRFDAAAMLGRVHLQQGRPAKAVKWFERAAEAPAPTPDAGRTLLYDLAHTLEEQGEASRALAVYVELDTEMSGYRDVSRRIERLSKVQARG